MQLTTLLPILLISGADAGAINNMANCQSKGKHQLAYNTAYNFCKKDNIDAFGDYARNGVVYKGKDGSKAKAFITSKNCMPGIQPFSTADCMLQMVFACSWGDANGFGTVRADEGGCLTFHIVGA